jgi:hypothetical protein
MSDEEAAELGLPPGPANPGVLRRAQNRVIVTTDSITMRYKPQLLIAHAVAFILTSFCMIEDFPDILFYVAAIFIISSAAQLHFNTHLKQMNSFHNTSTKLGDTQQQLATTHNHLRSTSAELRATKTKMKREIDQIEVKHEALKEAINKGIYDTLMKKALTKQLSRVMKDQERALLYQVLDHLQVDERMRVLDPSEKVPVAFIKEFQRRVPAKFWGEFKSREVSVDQLRATIEKISDYSTADAELEKVVLQSVEEEVLRLKRGGVDGGGGQNMKAMEHFAKMNEWGSRTLDVGALGRGEAAWEGAHHEMASPARSAYPADTRYASPRGLAFTTEDTWSEADDQETVQGGGKSPALGFCSPRSEMSSASFRSVAQSDRRNPVSFGSKSDRTVHDMV